MEGNAQKNIVESTGLDISSLRLPTNYGEAHGVKKLLTSVNVGRPKKSQFFRTYNADEMTFSAMFLEQKESREHYLVVPNVAAEIGELVRPVKLHAAIDRQNNVFLIPVPLPGESGTRNPWHESLAQAVECVSQTKLDTQSTANWTASPDQTDHP